MVTYNIEMDGMVTLYRHGVSLTNFGSGCRFCPTGERVPQYFEFDYSFQVVKDVLADILCDASFPDVDRALTHRIEREYLQKFQRMIDGEGYVRIPDNLC